ncbi:hypothetical protein BD324DRAFT_622049 [Kockovaella imperatae]|uniref:Uncharacterized protein n=1 Tax=Kockovaella imperatae TaxID=4999 RepID=A0A1Y1UML8_9TREE|nr:hypothetical protein BD324DRAFT_622049 [Kockovaella imperatae]ORX38716.1 hypothetical protein BD324DRAFT_622049 [Kockovaella imperatae]
MARRHRDASSRQPTARFDPSTQDIADTYVPKHRSAKDQTSHGYSPGPRWFSNERTYDDTVNTASMPPYLHHGTDVTDKRPPTVYPSEGGTTVRPSSTLDDAAQIDTMLTMLNDIKRQVDSPIDTMTAEINTLRQSQEALRQQQLKILDQFTDVQRNLKNSLIAMRGKADPIGSRSWYQGSRSSGSSTSSGDESWHDDYPGYRPTGHHVNPSILITERTTPEETKPQWTKISVPAEGMQERISLVRVNDGPWKEQLEIWVRSDDPDITITLRLEDPSSDDQELGGRTKASRKEAHSPYPTRSVRFSGNVKHPQSSPSEWSDEQDAKTCRDTACRTPGCTGRNDSTVDTRLRTPGRSRSGSPVESSRARNRKAPYDGQDTPLGKGLADTNLSDVTIEGGTKRKRRPLVNRRDVEAKYDSSTLPDTQSPSYISRINNTAIKTSDSEPHRSTRRRRGRDITMSTQACTLLHEQRANQSCCLDAWPRPSGTRQTSLGANGNTRQQDRCTR